MRHSDLTDIAAFLAVARESSFTKAAAQLGVSQSALSHTIRGLEERLGLRLLTRTTRSVAPTAAGERLISRVGPRLEEIDAELNALSEMREKPAGRVRINAGDHAARAVLWPALRRLLPEYPDIQVEVMVDQGLSDIVSERYDAGIRLGENLEKDMIAIPVSPEMQLRVVGSPSYFARHPKPVVPQDLQQHNCINRRLTTQGGLYAWEFEKDGRELKVRVDGQLTLNRESAIIDAALHGMGLAIVMEDGIREYVEAGRLETVLDDWSQPFPGYYLYYPSRRHPSPAFAVVAEALRYRG